MLSWLDYLLDLRNFLKGSLILTQKDGFCFQLLQIAKAEERAHFETYPARYPLSHLSSPFGSLYPSVFQSAEWPLQCGCRLRAAAAAARRAEARDRTATHTDTHMHVEPLLPVCLMFFFALIARLMPFKSFASIHSMQIQLQKWVSGVLQ